MAQKELEVQVSDATGLYMDSGYMNKILTGKRKAPKIVESICKVLALQESGA